MLREIIIEMEMEMVRAGGRGMQIILSYRMSRNAYLCTSTIFSQDYDFPTMHCSLRIPLDIDMQTDEQVDAIHFSARS